MSNDKSSNKQKPDYSLPIKLDPDDGSTWILPGMADWQISLMKLSEG